MKGRGFRQLEAIVLGLVSTIFLCFAVEIAMLTHYAKLQREADPAFNAAAFVEYYAIMSAQRNTRLLGTFARLNRRDGKPQYLRHQPRVWAYLKRALAHPSLAGLREWCTAYVPPPG